MKRATRTVALARSITEAAVIIRPPSCAIISRSTHLRHVGSPRTGRSSQHTGAAHRSYASSSSGSAGGVRISYLFGGLVGLGVLVTTYGLLEYYFSHQDWPEPVRTPLKAALKARNRGDYDRSEVYFQKAIEAALSLPSSSFAPDPLQKLTGLYISYAALLESQGQMSKAYVALRTAMGHLGSTPLSPASAAGNWAGSGYTLSPLDQIRAIGLSQKLGHMALQISSSSHAPPFPIETGSMTAPTSWLGAAETYLSGALTAMLKLGLNRDGAIKGSQNESVVAGRDVELADASEEDMGGRADKRGLGMTMEALAEVYSKKKQYDLAGQLLLQAISILLPPGEKASPTVQDSCQAALLMTTLSSHTLQPRTDQAVKVSRSWSLRALQIADKTLSRAGTDPSTLVCKRARGVGLHNLGMLAELDKNLPEALGNFEQALAVTRDIGFVEGRREAMEAIRRLRNQGVTEPTVPRAS